MLFKNVLDSILGQTSKVKILRFLNLIDFELSGREIAKEINISHVQCHKALKYLNQHGLIDMRQIGRSTAYKINKSHILYLNLIKPIFNSESTLLKQLTETILKKIKTFKPLSIIVFGSTIKLARPDSDIDLLIIFPNKSDIKQIREKIDTLEEEIITKFGNSIAPILIKQKEFNKKYKEKNNLYIEIINKGKILYGKTISELILENSKSR
jgi:predicted nucleotidyltransferase/predicted transcriptional regulator